MIGTDALVAALSAHESRVFNYFRRMGVDAEMSRDLSQETFLRAIAGARRYRGDASAVVWLLGIARNVYFEWVRAQMRARSTVQRMAASDDRAGRDDPAADPDVADALLDLDQAHREVLVLRYVLDLPSETVARLLGITDEATRQRVSRAKAEFRRAWEVSHART
jgi:RNA polymerase sigma-70 factor, ECF subfamily